MRIVFFGEDSFSAVVLISILEAGYDVVKVVTPYYENFVYKRLEVVAIKYGIPFERARDINSESFVSEIDALQPDLNITAHFQKLLKKNLIGTARKACLNLHPSILPAYRGMSPQHWPIILGDSQTGLTVHYIEEGIDTGNILVQKIIPISKDIYVNELQMQMIPVYKSIMVEGIKKIESGNSIGIKQDLEKGSFYGRFKRDKAEITPDTTRQYAYNLIRAISKPYIGAFYGDYILWKAHPLDESEGRHFDNKYRELGLHIEDQNSVFLKLKDGILKIDSYEKIKKHEGEDN